ncbi:MAG: hypothetical protein ABIG61_06020 [Planctomycetota bacterium]
MSSSSKGRWWVPALLVGGAVLILVAGTKWVSSAEAEIVMPPIQQGQILAVPLDIGRDSYGIVLIDTSMQTLLIYEINSRAAAHNRLRLLAARSWKYDRLLEQYNTAEPTPPQVRMLIERLQYKEQQDEQDQLQLQEEMLKEQEEQLRQQAEELLGQGREELGLTEDADINQMQFYE